MITDASAVASFITAWASSSQAEVPNETIHQPNFDLGSLFSPITGQDISLVLCNLEMNVVMRRFVFNAAATKKLKANTKAIAQIQTNGMECQPNACGGGDSSDMEGPYKCSSSKTLTLEGFIAHPICEHEGENSPTIAKDFIGKLCFGCHCSILSR
ncbi:unnamed protein product [Ilex paraguariensis]|uniref:Uncharacterized protein n=1 Tax=Ilex paraguariensis TaxID=185542 RepID=A0ABC8TX30_9AQUA